MASQDDMIIKPALANTLLAVDPNNQAAKNPYAIQATAPGGAAGGKKNGAPAADYVKASREESRLNTQLNRPNQTNAFGASNTWSQDANGNWTQTQSFGGPLGGLFGNLQGQTVNAMGQPMDWGQFGQVGTGDDAVNQAYSQMTSRLDPEWSRREEAARTQLLNQGLDPNSEAAQAAMSQLGQQRNDAYGAARMNALQHGRGVFQDNMMARQQAIAEALGQRGQAFGELGQMQKFLAQPGFQGVDAPNLLAANRMTSDYYQQKAANEQQLWSDIIGGFTGGATKFLGGIFG